MYCDYQRVRTLTFGVNYEMSRHKDRTTISLKNLDQMIKTYRKLCCEYDELDNFDKPELVNLSSVVQK